MPRLKKETLAIIISEFCNNVTKHTWSNEQDLVVMINLQILAHPIEIHHNWSLNEPIEPPIKIHAKFQKLAKHTSSEFKELLVTNIKISC